MDTEQISASIVHDLANTGYSVSEGLFAHSQILALAQLAVIATNEGRMSPAGIGRRANTNSAVRGDEILWLDDTSTPAAVDCLHILEKLRTTLNEKLFLNAHHLESHLAVYPRGSIYQKHLDQFSNGKQARLMSFVLYLNHDWTPADGGALRLYLDEVTGEYIDVSPVAGRLVLFKSSQFWHEVLPASRQRLSLTGWFRARPSL